MGPSEWLPSLLRHCGGGIYATVTNRFRHMQYKNENHKVGNIPSVVLCLPYTFHQPINKMRLDSSIFFTFTSKLSTSWSFSMLCEHPLLDRFEWQYMVSCFDGVTIVFVALTNLSKTKPPMSLAFSKYSKSKEQVDTGKYLNIYVRFRFIDSM